MSMLAGFKCLCVSEDFYWVLWLFSEKSSVFLVFFPVICPIPTGLTP